MAATTDLYGSAMQAIKMPRNCDDPPMVLKWSADEFLPGFGIFTLGMLINQKIICLVIAIVVTKMFKRMKEGTPDGFLLHLGYWVGLITAKRTYSMRNAFIREYIL
jgi:conjugal transfer pilus assembly protein TraL